MSIKNFFDGKLSPKKNIVLVTMAGGSGTRFWPMSRQELPKQFLPLSDSGKSLIEESIERFEPLVGKNASLVVTALSQVEHVKKAVPDSSILAEPLARNTAACLALSAYFLLEEVGDLPMICTPADHLVKGDEALRGVFRKATALVETEDVLITIGIKPSSPETGYGYIKRGDSFTTSSGQGTGAFKVAQFVEKPDKDTAVSYVESGDFYWNSGMFVWRPSVLLKEVESLLPETSRLTKECVKIIRDPKGSTEELIALYKELDSVSIDYGIMEEAKNVVVFPGHNFQWSDIGSWSSWYESSLKDSSDGFQNITKGNVLIVGSEGCAVVSSTDMGIKMTNDVKQSSKKERLIAAVGLEDIIIVDTDDCLLVCKKDEAQRVKQVVDILKKRKQNDYL